MRCTTCSIRIKNTTYKTTLRVVDISSVMTVYASFL